MRTKRAAGAAVLLTGSMLLTACGGGGGGGGGDTSADGGGTFSVFIQEPENPLVPGNTGETEGGQVVDALWTGLVEYDRETNQPVYTGVAESIESDDQTTWTVNLKDGWTFHDGTPVTAQNYVDTWNYVANSENAQQNSYFFSTIEGYEDLQAEEGGSPAAAEMSGLRVIDDTTFEVTLSAPYAQWPTTVGYTAFFPLPQAFFDDPEGFGEQPVGNGPFRADEAFQEGQGITLTRYDEYGGEEPAKAEGVEFRVYTEINTAYNDVQAGSLDVIGELPPDAIASAQDQFGDRYKTQPLGDMTALGFPTYDERFADPEVRRAFSMAIDRQAITVEEANRILDEAGFDRSQPVDLWFNAGAGHEEWMQAIGNQLRENLGIEYQLRGDLQFAEYLPLQDEQGMTGPFRSGWVMDYPVMENFLGPTYSTAALPPAGSNKTFYSNEEFDAKLLEGNSADSPEAAIQAYQEAEDLLVRDMPATPLFSRVQQYVHSENVSDVFINSFDRVQVEDVVVGSE